MKKKYLAIIAGFIMSIIIIMGVVSSFAFHKISLISIPELEKLISTTTGYNVAIANIKPKWNGINLVMRIEYITLQDKVTALPVFQADYLEGKVNFWQTVRNMDLWFYRITDSNSRMILGSINFQIENLAYYDPNIFLETIYVPLVHGKITWQKQDNKIFFALKNTDITLPEVKIKADIGASYQDGKLFDIIAHAVTNKIAIEAAHKYIPVKILPKELSEWLHGAVHNGTILSNSLVFGNGKFDWIMNFKDVNLNYAPKWPVLLGLSGNLHLTEKQITILGVSGKIMNIPIGLTTVSVDGLNCKESFPLVVESEVNATLSQGLQFLLSSPLRYIGKVLAEYKPQGNMKLDLNLKVPLVNTSEAATKIDSKLKLSNGVFVDPQLGITLTELGGTIGITENKITADQLATKFLGQPSTASIYYDTSKAKSLGFVLKTRLQDKVLVNLLPILSNANITGSTKFEIKATIPMVSGIEKQLLVNSDLSGLNIKLPSPIGKETNEKIQTSLTFLNNNTLKISYGNKILGELTLDGNHAVKAGYFEKLTILNSQFNSVQLHYNTAAKTIALNGEDISGSITLATKDLPVQAEFKKITITNQLQEKIKFKYKFKANNLPKVIFQCDHLTINSNYAGAISFKLNPQPYGYNITDLELDSKDFNLQGKGKWNMLEPVTTHLSGDIASDNFGRVFHAWNLGKSIKNGSGTMAFIFDWQGDPADFKLANLAGQINLDIKSGQIQGVDPGLGRIMGLLSLDNIQRRLKLDFSDLFGSGFSFDKLQANFNVKYGELHTDGVFIDGPSAYIALSGDASTRTKQINFKMGVGPKVSASLPLAAITAGNPAIGVAGAAFWILSKVTTSKPKANEISKYRYQVTGTWDKPKINEIANR